MFNFIEYVYLVPTDVMKKNIRHREYISVSYPVTVLILFQFRPTSLDYMVMTEGTVSLQKRFLICMETTLRTDSVLNHTSPQLYMGNLTGLRLHITTASLRCRHDRDQITSHGTSPSLKVNTHTYYFNDIYVIYIERHTQYYDSTGYVWYLSSSHNLFN